MEHCREGVGIIVKEGLLSIRLDLLYALGTQYSIIECLPSQDSSRAVQALAAFIQGNNKWIRYNKQRWQPTI